MAICHKGPSMNNVICAIAKNEHLYINEWIQYHFNIGFNHIYLFDNDDVGSVFIGNIILPQYMDRITIFDVRGIKKYFFQPECYNVFYAKYNQTFDWCAFIDIDEYIVLNKWQNITEMLLSPIFQKATSIKLHWHMYGDDGFITRDTRVPVHIFFKKQIIKKNIELFTEGKQITRGKLSNVYIDTHSCRINGMHIGQVTADGIECRGEITATDKFGNFSNNAFINHYMTKTLEEFIKQKLNRGDAMFDKRVLDFDYYWQLNEKTPEKLKYIQEFGNRNE